MPAIQFVALPTEEVLSFQAGGPDAHGQVPQLERAQLDRAQAG